MAHDTNEFSPDHDDRYYPAVPVPIPPQVRASLIVMQSLDLVVALDRDETRPLARLAKAVVADYLKTYEFQNERSREDARDE